MKLTTFVFLSIFYKVYDCYMVLNNIWSNFQFSRVLDNERQAVKFLLVNTSPQWSILIRRNSDIRKMQPYKFVFKHETFLTKTWWFVTVDLALCELFFKSGNISSNCKLNLVWLQYLYRYWKCRTFIEWKKYTN